MLSVDRIEGEYAVCEQKDGKFVHLLLSDLPQHVHEGDVLEYVDGFYVLHEKETEKRKSENIALLKKLLKK